MEFTKRVFESMGLPAADPLDCPTSHKRFPNGGQYRIEIPSTEGPRSFAAVLDEADKRKVPVHRVSQGSGIMLLTDEEISEMLEMGRASGIEVNLFIGPRGTFDTGAQVYSAGGKALGLSPRGATGLFHSILDLRRAVLLGLRSVLISDIGTLQVVSKMRSTGDLPPDLIIKTSVMMAPTNPASARLLEDLGADSINIPSDLSIPQIAALRATLGAFLDFYVEAPDNIGGFIRYYEIPELIRVGAPIYFKLGLRNSPDVYPSGLHLENTVVNMSRERVRRAQIVMEMIKRHAPDAEMSPLP